MDQETNLISWSLLQPFEVCDELVLVADGEAAGEPVDLHYPGEGAEVLPFLLAVTEVPDPSTHFSVIPRRYLEIIWFVLLL